MEEANPSLPVLCWWDLIGHLQAQQHASLLPQLDPLGWGGAGTAQGMPVLREISPVSLGLEVHCAKAKGYKKACRFSPKEVSIKL